jgi:LysR family transcriptional regulator, hydrogen peroxide-inducible genes activator
MAQSRVEKKAADAATEPTLEQAEALVKVARAKSIRGAAAELRLASPTAVYHRLQRLAEALGVGPLVTGSVNGKVALTPDGQQVLPQAQALLDAHQALRGSGQTIRFACYPILAGRAAPTVLDFARTHQRDQVEIVFHGISDELRRDRGATLLARAATGEVDVVIAPLGNDPRGLERRYLYSWNLRLVVHDGNPLREREWVTIDELKGRQLLVAPPGHLSRQLFESAASRAAVPPRIAMELVDQHAMRAIATAGDTYAALVPDDAFGIPNDKLGPLLLDDDGEELRGAYALFYSKRHVVQAASGIKRSQIVLELVDALHEALTDELPAGALARRRSGQ